MKGEVTVSDAVLLWLSAPLAPVIVSVLEPKAAEELAQACRCETPAPAMEGKSKLAVTPGGTPLTLRFTVLLKPLMRPMIVIE
jgi:hypothetical protein